NSETINGPNDAARLLIPLLRPLRKETFAILCLDTRARAISIRKISVGSLNASIAHPREVFFEAIQESAASIIVAHNHPSTSPDPSPQDIEVTDKLVQCGQVLGIPVLDHLIIGSDRVHSVMDGKNWPK